MNASKLLSVFATSDEQIEILGMMRVVANDGLSALLGAQLALTKLPPGSPVYELLNRNPSFWNVMLLAQQTNLLVLIGRIYDNKRSACLRRILKFIETRKQLAGVATLFASIESEHKTLLKKIEELRNNVFAHSSEHKALHIAFGFEGLAFDEFEGFCRKLIAACDALAVAIFQTSNFGPRLRENQLDLDVADATEAWEALVAKTNEQT